MKVRISLEQTIDVDEATSGSDIKFENYIPSDMSNEEKVAYLIDRFAEDIDRLVKYDEVLDNITVEYLEN